MTVRGIDVWDAYIGFTAVVVVAAVVRWPSRALFIAGATLITGIAIVLLSVLGYALRGGWSRLQEVVR